MAWAYDNPELRDLLHQGLIHPDEIDMEKTFLEWKDDDWVATFLSKETGETKDYLSSKRGNASYARNKSMKAWENQEGDGRPNLGLSSPWHAYQHVQRYSSVAHHIDLRPEEDS